MKTENTQTIEVIKQYNNIPTLSIKRNQFGLLENFDYKFTEEGYVDWRNLIPIKYLLANRDKTQETDVSKLEEKDLLLSLQGIKYISKIRGYKSIIYNNIVSSPDHCTASCEITWIPNFETENLELKTSGIGDATQYNCKSFAKLYLGPISENRAFVRCVKNALGINILSSEEIGDAKVMEEAVSNSNIGIKSPTEILKDLMDKHHYSFESIKAKLIKEGDKDAELYSNLEEISPGKKLHLIERIKAKDNKK